MILTCGVVYILQFHFTSVITYKLCVVNSFTIGLYSVYDIPDDLLFQKVNRK